LGVTVSYASGNAGGIFRAALYWINAWWGDWDGGSSLVAGVHGVARAYALVGHGGAVAALCALR